MKVTCRADKDVRLIHSAKAPNLLAAASITLDGEFVVRGLSVMRSQQGIFVSYPSQPYRKDGGETQYQNTAFPLNKTLRDAINNTVLDAYNQARARTAEQHSAAAQNTAAEHNPIPEPAMNEDEEEEFENF